MPAYDDRGSVHWDGGDSVKYECVRCGASVTGEDIEMRGGEVKCIICGYRVLKKVKPPVVKRLDAV